MKRYIALIGLVLAWAFSAPVSHAQTAGGSYEEGLKLVRAGQWERALVEFKPLAEEGHAASQFSMALIFHLGRGVPVDLEVAYNWYKQAALQKHPQALNNLAMMYLNGEYVARNYEIAFKVLQLASTENFAQANDNLGQCYENGWGVKQSIRNAIDAYIKAGDTGYIKGYANAAKLLEQKRADSEPDIDKAVEYYIKAAEVGNQEARRRLIRLKRLPDHLQK